MERFLVGYTFRNHVLRLRLRVAVKLNFRPYIRRYTSPNENFEYSYPLSILRLSPAAASCTKVVKPLFDVTQLRRVCDSISQDILSQIYDVIQLGIALQKQMYKIFFIEESSLVCCSQATLIELLKPLPTVQRLTLCCSRDSMKTEEYVTMQPNNSTLFIFGEESFTYLKKSATTQWEKVLTKNDNTTVKWERSGSVVEC